MARLSAVERKRCVAEMRDRLADYVLSDNPNAERNRAADIALRYCTQNDTNWTGPSTTLSLVGQGGF